MVLGALHARMEVGGERHYRDKLITEEDLPDMPRDKLAALVGDGQAKVTCSFDLSDKDYGNGFGVRCEVTLTCNQSEDDVSKAADIAASLASEYTEDMFGLGETLFKELVPDRSKR